MASFTITPATSIHTTLDSDHAFDSDSLAADTLTVNAGAFVVAEGLAAAGAFLTGTGAWKVTVNGYIVSAQQVGLLLDTGIVSASTITIGIEGEIGGGAGGIALGSPATIRNAGLISASDDLGIAIDIVADGICTITNTGEITSPNIAIRNASGVSHDRVTNTGQIVGDIGLGAGNDVLSNRGQITGDVDLSIGTNSLVNAGTISGDVNASSGLNTITNAGTITDDVFLLGTLSNTGTIGDDVTGSSVRDVVTNSRLIDGLVTLDGGDDLLTNTGTIGDDVSAGEGNDTISNVGSVFGFVSLGDGNNTLSNRGTITGFVSGGSGNDTVANLGTIDGDVHLDLGNGIVTNSGQIDGDVTLGDGTNALTNSGTITGDVFGGDTDTIVNSGLISDDIVLFDGINRLTNSGRLEGSLDLGDGTNIVANSGTITFDIEGGDGTDTLTNSGSMTDDVSLGGGNDTFTNSGTVGGTIDLGDGQDILVGGNGAETVMDDDGADTYTLGAGNDTFLAVGNSGADGNDIVNAGTGIDRYDALDAGDPVFINLDAIAHDGTAVDPNAVLIAANTATGQDVAGTAPLKDTIIGFENASGGDQDDVIYGTALVNILSGRSGADILFGFAGNDTLSGGADDDILVGGLGKELLTGGSGADEFVYLTLADSGLAKALRDRIADFSGNGGDGDVIDLSAIDADTTNGAGTEDSFTFIGTNVLFTGQAGELRAYWTVAGQMIEGDVTGDGAADFRIELVDPTHDITLVGVTDFVL